MGPVEWTHEELFAALGDGILVGVEMFAFEEEVGRWEGKKGCDGDENDPSVFDNCGPRTGWIIDTTLANLLRISAFSASTASFCLKACWSSW